MKKGISNVIAGLTRNRRVVAGEGFTLAEVLITLGIIGIVAAMTMPTLITKYKNKQAVSQLKKSYAIVSNAFRMAEAKHGPVMDWAEWNDAEVILDKYIIPELKIGKKYGKSNNNLYSLCYEENSKIHANSNTMYVWLSNLLIATPIVRYVTASVQLVDGACLGINPKEGAQGYGLYLFLDVNGSIKGPNIAGRDLFFFYINQKGSIMPVGDTWSDEDLTAAVSGNGVKSGSCNTKSGIGGRVCAARIMRDGWEIKY